ncbi:sensor domain-containing protein [Candidatus Mycolicibacterium alkanivorans]|uniref:Sensor domain-containing protein n=1 Tax=Candidatus Mycolicibacterium alkanivorans TaxID=2954114 RepID=A0ABS9YWF2_9MYCO|nr:sensor domain-containing protein [Candidatus Mycolicibacterium alkanivorans]MCI4675443.1 sensor domain-containing protein [Candidatus Mycolicibacterium alkanivorans]
MTCRLPTLAALLCMAVSGCAATTAGTAMPAERVLLTTADALPTLLLSASDVGTALASDDVVVTSDVTKAWNDSGRLADVNCLAVAGAAQQSVYADSGSTAVHGQVVRDPPTAPAWSHYAVQAVVLFPTAQAAAEFFTTSQQRWAGCSNRELTYPQPLGPEQVWSVGQTSTDRDVLAVSRVQENPEKWSCQRALTVHSNVAVDVEACSLDGPTSAAAAIAGQIAGRLPAA